MAREDTDLPFGDAFSPKQLDTGDGRDALPVVLELVAKHEGNPDAFDEAVRQTFFPDDDGTRSKNVRLGLSPSGYRIVDDAFEFTALGEELYELRNDSERLYERFAQHILRNLHGLKGIEIVEDLRAQGKKTTNENVKQEFREQYDFHIDRTSNHWSQMRAWLAKAGIVNTGTHLYDIDRTRVEELIGIDSEDILELDGLTDEQQAFLRALALINPQGAIKNRVVREIAEEAYGVDIEQSNISRKTLDPLEEAGYIEWTHVSGKPNLVEPTEKFDAEVLKPVLDDLAERTGVPRNVLRKTFEEVLGELDQENAHEKGVALETLAVKIGRLLGLEFAGWRVRGRETGGSEVDVVFDDIGTVFNRVQIQCKNTPSQQLEAKHVARDVGITRTLQTNTVLLIARGGVSTEAQRFADRVMQHENLAIFFLTDEDIANLDTDTDHLLNVLRGESRRAHGIKKLGLREGIEDDTEVDLTEREDVALRKYQAELDDIDQGKDAQLTDFGDER